MHITIGKRGITKVKDKPSRWTITIMIPITEEIDPDKNPEYFRALEADQDWRREQVADRADKFRTLFRRGGRRHRSTTYVGDVGVIILLQNMRLPNRVVVDGMLDEAKFEDLLREYSPWVRNFDYKATRWT